MRSINTSLVAIMPILSILVIGSLVLGATALQDFGLALFIGLLTGAYSSIFIASPVLADAQGARAPLHPDPPSAWRPGAAADRRTHPGRGCRSRSRRGRGIGQCPAQTSRRRSNEPRRRRHRHDRSTGTDRLTRPATGLGRDRPSSRRPFRGRPRPGSAPPRGSAGQPPAAAAAQEGPAALDPACRGHLATDPPTGTVERWVTADWLKELIRDIPDFPRPGVSFKDITPLLADVTGVPLRRRHPRRPLRRPRGSTRSSASRPEASSSPRRSPTASAPASSRSARPASCRGRSRSRSTSSSTAPTCSRSTRRPGPGERVLIIDDVMATGGHRGGHRPLVERLGATVVGMGFVIELAFLGRPGKLERLSTLFHWSAMSSKKAEP